MPTLYEHASDPIHYAATGTPLLLSDGRILNWRLIPSAGRNFVRGDFFDANGVATGQFFQTTHRGFDHDIVALNNGGVAIVYYNDDISPSSPDSHEVYLTIYNALGVKVVESVQVNVLNHLNQYDPEVAVLESGRIVVTWTDDSGMAGDPNRGVMARMFNPDGSPVGGEFLVNTNVGGLQENPFVRASLDGGFVIGWTSGSQLFDADGNRIGPEGGGVPPLYRLHNGNLLEVSGASLTVYDPGGTTVLATATAPGQAQFLGSFGGGFVLSIGSFNGPVGTAIFDNMAVQQGTLFAQPISFITAEGADGFVYYSGNTIGHVRPDDGVGDLTVTPTPGGLSEATPQNNYVASVTAVGEPLNSTLAIELVSDSLGGGFQLIGNQLFLIDNANLDFETAATVSVTIRATDINGASYLDTFVFNVQDEAQEQRITGSPVIAPYGPGLTELESGRFVALIAVANVPASGRLLDADLNPYKTFTIVEDPALGYHIGFDFVALDSGGFAVTWMASGGDGQGPGIMTRVFDAEGNAVSDVILINTPTPYQTESPVIAAFGTGNFVVAWQEFGGDQHSYGVKAQLFGASGAKIGAEFIVNTNQGFSQSDPSLASLPGGGFLAFWTDSSGIGGDNSFNAIKGQLFNAAGAKTGGEFLVNTSMIGDQRQSAVTVLASGNVLVTWASAEVPSTNGPGTFRGQLFDAAGAKIGGEILLESFNSAISDAHWVTALPGGGFALAWNDRILPPDVSGASVWARAFNADGSPATARFLVNTDIAGNQTILDFAVLPSGELYVSWSSPSPALELTQARIFDLTGTRTDWAEDDRLAGTAGADVMAGGSGNDIYVVNHPGDVAIELPGQGIDIIYSSISYSLTDAYEVESLATFDWDSTEPLNLTGNGLNNTLIGNAGANQLNGAAGADIMFGREGNDIYIVDNVGDQPTEYIGEGIDTVYSSISYTLAAGTDVEGLATLDWGATTPLNLTGNGLANTLIGNAGANQLDGAGGADVMVGREGNDIYLVDNALDKAFETAGQGYDVIYTGVSFALTNDQSLEGLSTINWLATDAINLTGNSADNYLIGNAGANVLNGGAGNDVLHGKEGADTYQFTALLGPTNVDLILEYSSADDTIALDNNGIFTGLADGALPASAFVIGGAAQDADDRIVYNSATGQLFFDADGSGAGAQVQFALLSGAPAITAADFIVI